MFIPEDDKCSTSAILNQAIISSEINVFDHDPTNVWTCDTTASNCPQAGLTCYSHHSSGFPALCIQEPSLGGTDQKFKEINAKTQFPRFKSIFVLKKSADGYPQNTSWIMDENKCHPEKMTTTHNSLVVSVDLDKCIDRFSALLSGGNTKKIDAKYCDSSKLNEEDYAKTVLSDVEEIGRCSQMYPNFLRKFQEHRNSFIEKVLPKPTEASPEVKKE